MKKQLTGVAFYFKVGAKGILKIMLFVALVIFVNFESDAQSPATNDIQPIKKVRQIADKLVANSPFEYRLEPKLPYTNTAWMHFLNLGENFGPKESGVAYAISAMESTTDQPVKFELSHTDGLKVWINGNEVYEHWAENPTLVKYQERYLGLDTSFIAKLKKGSNTILIKSEKKEGDWKVYLRTEPSEGLELRVDKLPMVHESMKKVTNWLVAGPFKSPEKNGKPTGLETVFPPEQGFETAMLYENDGRQITWSIPKMPIQAKGFGSNIAGWGETFYSWNYHAGGTAWSMAHLGDYLNEAEYLNYSKKYGDFYISKKPYLYYQKHEQGGFDYADNRIYESKMLDFTSAPALPLVYWLNKEKDFKNREKWQLLFEDIFQYVVYEQVRLPEGNFTRDTPVKYTTWADDMFMGLPFLMRSAEMETDKKKKEALWDDAAKQFVGFNKQVWDDEFDLYRQAQYSENKVKIPFWSRANGWAIWATTELLAYLPKNHPERKKILKHYQSHVNALVEMQNKETGFWHNLLNRLDSFEETSGTAIFVYCMARGINEGWLKERDYKQNVLLGWKALETMIENDGTLHGTCVGTNMSEDEQHYYDRPVYDDDTHGIFPVIFAGIEVDKLLKN